MRKKQRNYNGNRRGNILIITENLTADKYFQDFHNLICYRKSNTELLFLKDFLILKPTQASKFLAKANKISYIIIDNEKFKLKDYKFSKLKAKEWLRKEHSIYINNASSMALFKTKNFKNLTFQTLNEICSDIQFISLSGMLNLDVFQKNRKELIYFQYSCTVCNEYNLFILHNTEPLPDKCSYCNSYASGTKGILPKKTLILQNNQLKSIV